MTGTRGVTGYPNEPPGLMVLDTTVDGIRWLAYDPDYDDPPGSPWADAGRTWGWYYGFPHCCVEAFVARRERLLHDSSERDAAFLDGIRAATSEAEERAIAGAWIATEMPPDHPVSGHVLCPACEAGPMAPLPPRPAKEYGFFQFVYNEPVWTPPHGYEGGGDEKAAAALSHEQLALELVLTGRATASARSAPTVGPVQLADARPVATIASWCVLRWAVRPV